MLSSCNRLFSKKNITRNKLFINSGSSSLAKLRLSRNLSITIPDSLLQHEQKPYEFKGVSLPGRAVYLDAQSTTPMDPRVLDTMMPFYTEAYGNPHSRNHLYGWESDAAVEKARSQISHIIGSDDPRDIVFTSGATESNNTALKGVAHWYGHKKKHVITTALEHKCVLDSCRILEQEGYDVTYLPVQKNGLIDLNKLEDTLKSRPDTALVSIMAVNNEIGVIQPLTEIGKLCRKYDALFHTDAAQAVGKIPIDVNSMNIDLLSISGHKLYGPKGVGALYLRRRKPRVKVRPIINGGGQERGIRSGTVPTPLAVGLGEACEIAEREMENDAKHSKKLFDKLYNKITSELEDVYLNGDKEQRWFGNLNLSFAYVEGESMLLAIRSIACSSGSACTSASLEPSYVLRALGVDEELAHTSIRFGIDRFTSEEEIDFAGDVIVEKVKKLRALSPLYHMVKKGIDLKSIDWSGH